MFRVIAHLDMDAFYASVEQCDIPATYVATWLLGLIGKFCGSTAVDNDNFRLMLLVVRRILMRCRRWLT